MKGKFISAASIKNSPKVTILLLNYNGWRYTVECLESIYMITYPNWEIILVDNGSDDNSVSKIKEWAAGRIPVESKFFEYDVKRKPIEYIEELLYDKEEAKVKVLKKEKEWDMLLPYQKLSILRIEKNCGFTGGNNIGIEYILKERKTDYILLLSNDTVVDKEFMRELINVAESDKKIGIVGPKIYYYDEINKIAFAGGKINLWRGKSYHIGINEIDNKQYDKIKEVDYIEGSCLLIKREVIEKINIISTEYFAYWEDADWCVKAHNSGYKIVYVPKSKIWHKESSTFVGPLKVYYLNRNRFLFMKKHATKMQILSFLMIFFIIEFWFKTSVFLLYYKKPKLLIPFYKGTLHGVLIIIGGDLI